MSQAQLIPLPSLPILTNLLAQPNPSPVTSQDDPSTNIKAEKEANIPVIVQETLSIDQSAKSESIERCWKAVDIEDIQESCQEFVKAHKKRVTNNNPSSEIKFLAASKKLAAIFQGDLFQIALQAYKQKIEQAEQALHVKAEEEANQAKFIQAEKTFEGIYKDYKEKFTRNSKPEDTAPLLQELFQLSNVLEELRPFMEQQSKNFEDVKRFKSPNTSEEDYKFRIELAKTNPELLSQLTTLEPKVKSWEKMNAKITEIFTFAGSHWKTHPKFIELAISLDPVLNPEKHQEVTARIEWLKKDAPRVTQYASLVAAMTAKTSELLNQILNEGMTSSTNGQKFESYYQMSANHHAIIQDLEEKMKLESPSLKKLQEPFKAFIDERRALLSSQKDVAVANTKDAWDWQKGWTINLLSTEGLTVYLQRYADVVAKGSKPQSDTSEQTVEAVKILSPFAKEFERKREVSVEVLLSPSSV